MDIPDLSLAAFQPYHASAKLTKAIEKHAKNPKSPGLVPAWMPIYDTQVIDAPHQHKQVIFFCNPGPDPDSRKTNSAVAGQFSWPEQFFGQSMVLQSNAPLPRLTLRLWIGEEIILLGNTDYGRRAEPLIVSTNEEFCIPTVQNFRVDMALHGSTNDREQEFRVIIPGWKLSVKP